MRGRGRKLRCQEKLVFAQLFLNAFKHISLIAPLRHLMVDLVLISRVHERVMQHFIKDYLKVILLFSILLLWCSIVLVV